MPLREFIDETIKILDLRDLKLANRNAVRFLKGCEADGLKFENCPAYIREWMDRE